MPKDLKSVLFLIFLFVSWVSQIALGDSDEVVLGKNFKIPIEQQIEFVPLKKVDPAVYREFPKKVDLIEIQSEVKSQGMRGSCTYFVMTSLIESLIKKSTGKEIDLSEEYLAWAAKTKMKLRSREEDSSVAVNAATIQEFGLMFEKDLPYQPSWFDAGMPCEGQKKKNNVDPICYSHRGPKPDLERKIISGDVFEFRDISSSSLDIVRELAKWKSPITISILAHSQMWQKTEKTGDLYLDEASKKECQLKPKKCTGHAALIVGYDLEKKLFYLKNSWGKEWGRKGYGTISFDYIDQMSDRRLLIGRITGFVNLPKEM